MAAYLFPCAVRPLVRRRPPEKRVHRTLMESFARGEIEARAS
jgi:hypothetical protein